MTRSLIIVGCGGFGREVWALIQALAAAGDPWDVEGFVDDSPTDYDRYRVNMLGSTILGSVGDLAARQTPYSTVIAVGSPPDRRRLHAALASSPVNYPQLIHPDSTVSQPTVLGVGVVIAPGARVSTNVTVGAHVHIDQNVTVGHDTTIGDFARLNPQACISGSVTVRQGALIGASATVLPNLEVGAEATVGAGACVVRCVPAGVVVKGVPAA